MNLSSPGPESVEHEADVLLADGSTAHVRAIRPNDASRLIAFHRRLSPRTVILRYLGPHPVLSEREAEHFANVDGTDRVALIGERDGEIIAVARYDRSPGRDEAEVAFLIDDSFQGKGLGAILLEHLVVIARTHGVRRFVAETLAENLRMIGVLRDSGFSPQYQRSSSVITAVLDIAPTPQALAAIDQRDRRAVIHSIEKLLKPQSIAVIGAARAHNTIGHQVFHNLISGGFNGPVFPVNPAATSIDNVKCFPTIEAIPSSIDLAIVAVPAATVADVIEECGRKRVGAVVIISAGFAEMGPQGASQQREVIRLAHSYGMRVLGPNCFGVINTDPATSMNATFAPNQSLRGPLAFVSQSGGLGIALLGEIAERGLGISSFVSTGNKADISGNDLLRFWEQDTDTRVILMYLESFGNPRKFSRIAEQLSRSKPIVAVKSGRTAAGARGAQSHTAALASSDDVVDALFRKTGVIRVDTIEELFDVSEVLAAGPLPKGGRVGIVTNAGGPGILAADACVSHGLEVPELGLTAQNALTGFLAAGAGRRNPVDMIASATAEDYGRTMQVLFDEDDVDALVVIFTPPLVTQAEDVAAAVISTVEQANRLGRAKPVVACFLGATERPWLHRSESMAVPFFPYPESAARALAHVVWYSHWLERPPEPERVLTNINTTTARNVLTGALFPPGPAMAADHLAAHDGRAAVSSRWITGSQALDLLDAYGIPIAPTHPVASRQEAVETALSIGLPVALKATGSTILHKSDVGGVRLSLSTPDAVSQAYDDMHELLQDAMEGAVVQKMISPGVETIAGFIRDPAFGPCVLFGLGGTAVEVLDDHAIRLAPVTERDATELILSLRGAHLLTGFRGSSAVDIDSLADIVVRLGRLAEDLPELAEGDCNPVIASAEGAIVVDTRIRVNLAAPDDASCARRLS